MSHSFANPWTVTCQAPLSMGFPRQEYWNGLPFSSPGDLPNPGIEPVSCIGRYSFRLSHQRNLYKHILVCIHFLCWLFLPLTLFTCIACMDGFISINELNVFTTHILLISKFKSLAKAFLLHAHPHLDLPGASHTHHVRNLTCHISP